MEHDRVTSFEARQALAVSPSSPLAFFLGGVALAYGCEAERAIDWGGPFDWLKYCAYHALAVGNLPPGPVPVRCWRRAVARSERQREGGSAALPVFRMHCLDT